MSFANKVKNIFKPVDLTKGTPWKVILIFWIPVVLSYLFQQFYTLIDEMVLGQYVADSYVTGVDDTNSLVFLVLQFAFGCSAGFSVVSAAKKGENDIDGLRKSFWTQMFLALIVSIVLTIIAIPLVDPLLGIINLRPGGTDNNTYQAAKVFITTIYAGLFTQIFYNLICAFLRSIGDSLTPFLFLAGSTLLSVGLDFLFIAGIPDSLPTFGMGEVPGGALTGAGGIFGAAMSVNIAQFIAALGCIIYALFKYPFLKPHKEDFHFSFKFCWEHLKLGLPLAFQFSILAIGLIILQSDIVAFDTFAKNYHIAEGKFFEWNGIPLSPIQQKSITGDVSLSYNLAQTAFGPSNKFETALETTLDALGATMLSFCSQNRGARNYGRIKKGLLQSFVIGAIICTFIGAIELLSDINGGVLYLFLHRGYVTPAVIQYSQMYYFFIAPTTYILGLLFIVRSSVQGLGKSLFPLISGCLELVARVIIVFTIPPMVNGAGMTLTVNGASFTSNHYGWAYLSVCMAHPAAWILAVIPCCIALYFYIFKDKLEKEDFKKYGNGPLL